MEALIFVDIMYQTGCYKIPQNLSAKAQKFGILMKKGFIVVCSLCSVAYKTFLRATLKFETILERFFNINTKVFAP